jgi:hypothetical protein
MTGKEIQLKNIEVYSIGSWSEASQSEVDNALDCSKVYAIDCEKVKDFEYKIHIEMPMQIGYKAGSDICKIRFNYEKVY